WLPLRLFFPLTLTNRKLFYCIVIETQRIIGGHVVEEYSRPYQGLMLAIGKNFEPKPYCGCTLIADMWAVSAAHCWRPPKDMMLVFGEHRISEEEGFEQYLNVSKIFVHYFQYRTFDNDIMLMKLSKSAIINAVVAPALLPPPYTSAPINGGCTVSGWGVTSLYNPSQMHSDYLRAVDVELQPWCNYYYFGRITQNMLCAGSRNGGKDACQGDSGGPLICSGYLEGLVSWGIGCGNRFFPGVYTKIRNYVPWINGLISTDERDY
uniref:trypsin n=1 Tax=Neogobius melanostomus TaxID=47308 RepID=A0A8C6U5B8_9GOBI